MSADTSVDLWVTGGPGADAEELDALARQLRDRLLELDVHDVRARSGGRVPDGAKPGDAVVAGALVVTALPVVLPEVFRLLGTWVSSRPARGVRVELDGRSIALDDATPQERQRLIDAFLAPRPDSAPGAPEDPAGSPSDGE
ncbi:hypothetical protein [Streptomyces sp. cg36]|uniref:effector-associated constant component EACC1 n=1 Tax=Streptomyces sp. cg36 TaxID=3238798 RepID=UPI0034E2E8FF